MIRSICNTLFVLSVCATLYVAVQPAFGQEKTTPPASEWTPATVTALLIAIGGIITGIIGAVKGHAAQAQVQTQATAQQTQATAHVAHLSDMNARLNAHGQQITDIAKAMPTPEQTSAITSRLNGHDQQITDIAKAMPPPPR